MTSLSYDLCKDKSQDNTRVKSVNAKAFLKAEGKNRLKGYIVLKTCLIWLW